MRINNVSTLTSLKTVVFMTILTVSITIGFPFVYTINASGNPSFLGFINWIVEIFKTINNEEPAIAWILGGLIIVVYVIFISSIISRNKAVKLFNTGINIKYINLLPGRIEFFFNKPQYNFACAYSDIENLDMNIISKLVRTKNGSYIAFEQLDLTFTLLNDKEFSLSNLPSRPMNFIYKIIDWTRGVQSFNYHFSGQGEIPDYKEKIDEYIQIGYKDILGKNGASSLKLLSIIFFAIGVIPISLYSVSSDWFALFPTFLFFFIAFIFDIILIVDDIRDRNLRGYNDKTDIKQKYIFEKISIWHILIFKFIILALIVYFCILPK